MTRNKIDNNNQLMDNLKQVIAQQEIHHGYILEGPKTADKEAFAKWFIKAITCKEKIGVGCNHCSSCRKIEEGNHLDITWVEATVGKNSKVASVKDEEISRLQERLSLNPLEGDRNFAVIKNSDTMTPRAMNRLLKTLEEPPVGTVILFLSDNIYSFPATIRSRCVKLQIHPWRQEENAKIEKQGEKLLKALEENAPYYELVKMIGNIEKDKETVSILLDYLEETFGSKLHQREEARRKDEIYEKIFMIEEARSEVKNNINVTYILKNMVLNIRG